MGRSPCCSKEGLNRGAWTAIEDKILSGYIQLHGEGKWRNLPKRAGLKRCGKSCRLRWLNYLRPDIKRGNITHDEEELIIRLHNLLGNKWSLIAGRLPGRTDNEIKNYWNTTIGKRTQSSRNHAGIHVKTTSRIGSPRKASDTSPEPSDLTAKPVSPSDAVVVRTKATRCTKVVLFPHQNKNSPPEPEVNGQPLTTMTTSPLDDNDDFLSEFLGNGSLQQCSDFFFGGFDGDHLKALGEDLNKSDSRHVMDSLSDVAHHREENFLVSQDMLIGIDLPASLIDLDDLLF